MNEIELLRREYAAIPEPDLRMVEQARARLRRSQALPARPATTRPRLLLAVALVVAAASLITVERPFGNGGVDVARADPAAAGFRALSAATGVWHYRARSSLGEGSQVSERDVIEGWSTSRNLPWFSRSITERTPVGGASSFVEEYSSGRCGSIMWDGPPYDVLRRITDPAAAEPDPVADYRRAYLRGTVISQTATDYHGMPAYHLVFDLGPWRETWTIRRSDYAPLQVSGVNSKIGPDPEWNKTTYTLFQLLPATPTTLRHLRPHAHPNAQVLHYGNKPRAGCKRFGK